MTFYILTKIVIEGTIYLWPQWNLFKKPTMSQICCETRIKIENCSNIQYGIEVFNNQYGKAVLKANDTILFVDSGWQAGKIVSFVERTVDVYKLLNAFLLTRLSVYRVIEIHASLFSVDNKGIMFLGPSGIGKTTQAELWMKYRNAEIINGDMVFVKQEEDGFLGCGSPWHGSSPYCLNRQVPLAALVILKQSPENSIRRLTGFEMVSEVMNSVFFPTWYKEGHEAACKTLDALLRTVPVYELSCRPDEEAVRLTEEAVFGGRT